MLIVIGGIIDVADKSVNAQVAANWLEGIAFGIALLIFIIVAGENSNADSRGIRIYTEAVSVSGGIFIYSVILTVYNLIASSGENTFTITQTQGVITILLGIAGFGCCFLFNESPVYHLMKGDESEALTTVTNLYGETAASPETYNIFQEFKEYVHNDECKSIPEKIIESLAPLAKITAVRVFSTCTIILPVITSYSYASRLGFGISFGMVFFGITRFVGVYIGQFVFIDKIGRKLTLLVCSIVIGVLYIVIGVLIKRDDFIAVASLILVANVFCGIAQSLSSVYLSEAFEPSIKPPMIFFSILIENIVVVIVCATIPNSYLYGIFKYIFDFYTYYFVIGAFQLLLAVMSMTLLPETKKLSLPKAKDFFQNILNIGL